MNTEYLCTKKRYSLLYLKISRVRAEMEGFKKLSLEE